jgi:uncharacterized damage-inducible protein DinB
MKQYLINTFRFNDWAHRKMLAATLEMTDKKEAAAIFSHIIAVQDKWMRRAKNDPSEAELKWWDIFEYDELETRWAASLNEWIEYLAGLEDGDVESQVAYAPGPDDNGSSQSLRDIVLQLNYHSIHHRAEIGLRIRDQGLQPPAMDYIYYLPPGNQQLTQAVG